jgi:type IV secretory pathway ATPase VirB11/archaellum biosynthesis ATPase
MLKEMKSVGEVDLNHCLRKEFTRYIIEQLIDKRQSINLVGEKGTGKTRLLEDIRDCKLAGVKVILVDLKAHVNTYSGLLREIHRQLGLKEKVPGRP